MRPLSSDNRRSPDTAEMILARARKKGIVLWSEDGQLRCKAPRGVLSEDDVQSLGKHRAEIMARLEMAVGPDAYERDLAPRSAGECVPLTFSQLIHWNESELATQRCMRMLASPTSLQGPLNLQALRESIAAVIRRHDALRTSIEIIDGTPQQQISEFSQFALEVDELPATVNGSRTHDVEQWIVLHVGEMADVTKDPLMAIRLLKVDDEQHVLLLTMQHIISDGVSQGIVLRDIMTAYFQVSSGLEISLPPIPIQFPDYAVWQRSRAWTARRAAYWQQWLAGCPRVRFPVSGPMERGGRRGFASTPIRIAADMQAALAAQARRQRTTLVISVLSAYVALLMRWCNVSDIVVTNTTDGRLSARLEQAVGYFAFPLYLRITASGEATLSELMNQVASEYSTAQEFADCGHGDAHAVDRGFLQLCGFNWVPRGAEIAHTESVASKPALTYSPVYFEHPFLPTVDFDRDPVLLLYDLKTELAGGVVFSRRRFSDEAMASFVRDYLSLLETLVTRPETRIKDIPVS
jgi:hypothetical protein